jgi:Domain of unknown function (DUF4136)
MRKYAIRLLPLMAGAVCLLLAAEVRTDYNHAADFAQFRTYSWIQVEASPLWQDRIMQAVDGQLASKGWTKVPSGGDAAVSAFGSHKEKKTLETFYTGVGGRWFWRGWGPGLATTTIEKTPIGTVVVDIFDSHTERLVWRGIASDSLSEKPEKNEKKLEKNIAKMFEHFPPPPRV